MIRTKGEAGTGNVVEAVRHIRAVTTAEIAWLGLDPRRAGWPGRDLAARSTWCRWPSRESCLSSTSPPAVSPRRPTPPS